MSALRPTTVQPDRLARQTAQREALDCWLLRLELPSYDAVVNYADNRVLRQEMYTAYVTRVSAGGYDAGYYSCKWAEVLPSDACSLFEENGILDRATRLDVLRHIFCAG